MGLLRQCEGLPRLASNLTHIVAGALSTSDINETLQSSLTNNRTPLQARITFTSDEWRQHFLLRLEEETAGQPRLVHYFLEGMSMQCMHINSATTLEEALEVGERRAANMMGLSTYYTPNGSIELCYSLLILAALNVPLNSATQVSLCSERVTVQVLVHKFNLYAVLDNE